MRRILIDAEVHRMVERHRRSSGESENDILRRILSRLPAIPAASPDDRPPPPAGTRRRGQWTVEIRGERLAAANLKHAYRTLLEALDRRFPDFLGEFAQEKGRSRRFVAGSPAQLYPASPHLAGRHALLLAPGWYFDSNVSAVQVARRARIAARICGLRYGRDVRILENLREI